MIGAYYNGIYYSYKYDDTGIIDGMLDINGNPVVKYEYDKYGRVSYVYSYEEGEWVKNDDPSFIGNKNKMLSAGMFFDTNTNCYYIYERYFDPVADRYLDGTSNTNIFVNKNPFLNLEDEVAPCDDTPYLKRIVTEWAEDLLSSSEYGHVIKNHTAGWYLSLSDVEIVARAIYCEGGTVYNDEQTCVANVILNRVYHSWCPDTPIEVVLQGKQFASIKGGEWDTYGARIPDTESTLWKHATYLACLLMTTTDKHHCNALMGNPLNGQIGFYSYSAAKNNNIFYSSNGNLMYGGDKITNVFVKGYGYVYSFDALFSTFNPPDDSRNIYYSYL